MSLQKGNLKELRNLIKQIVRKELNEANVSSNIDGGEGPPSTPNWVSRKKKSKKKKKSGYNWEAHRLVYTFVFESIL